jgi:hypothetical protein
VIAIILLINLTTMKLGSGILEHLIQNSKDEDFHFYNLLVLMDDLAFQRTHFKKMTPNISCLYQHDTASDDHEDLHLQNRSNDQNNELPKTAILIATNACTHGIYQALIDSENKTRKPRNNDTSNRQRNIRTCMPYQTYKPTTTTPSI